MKRILILAVVAAAFYSCDKDKEDILISPSNADALSQVLIMPAGTQTVSGQPPGSSGGGSAPAVMSPVSNTTSSNGSTVPLVFGYSGSIVNLGGCYVYIDGAGRYFNIPYSGTSGASGQLQVPIGIPTNVDEGEFCVSFAVYDVSGRVSNYVVTCISVLRLGTGSLQVSLSWDNSSDQDLYVTTPNGVTIYYGNSEDSSGGMLDRDDIDGYGPENVFWENNAPNGTYTVQVKDFSGISAGTNFYVTVSGPGITRSFDGRTQNGNTVTVTSFTKNGNSLSF